MFKNIISLLAAFDRGEFSEDELAWRLGAVEYYPSY